MAERRLSSIPVSLVIPTRNRPAILDRMLKSLLEQSPLPAEIVVIDSSDDLATKQVFGWFANEAASRGCVAVWQQAEKRGAAVQRNQGVSIAHHATIAFSDDDILFESECIARLWDAMRSDPMLGGVCAMITNQHYESPGFVSRTIFQILAGKNESSYAGRLLGPAVNLLPEDRNDLPEIVPVEWMNTTCTFYRREALPDPPFSSFFTGYSLMEDVALSARVAHRWKLANVRTARIFHDSQPGDHKSSEAALSEMELVNRYHVMTEILGRNRPSDYARLVLWEVFQLSGCAVQKKCGKPFWRMLKGKLQGVGSIASTRPRRITG